MNFSLILQQKIDSKTKPLGALGKLEKIAFQIGSIQKSLEPQLTNPHMLLFAGDHGIAQSGVSAYPQEVTHQMVLNILNGGAAISIFSEQNKIKLKTIDAGVNHDFNNLKGLINNKINKGTKNFLYHPAMTDVEIDKCLKLGHEIVENVSKTGCNVIGFGEMGIGNTSSASMIMHYITRISLSDCIGRGTGVNNEQFKNKINILKQAKKRHGLITSPKEILQTFGGFEMAQMCGAMLAAYQKNMVLLIDGFIASSVFLVAVQMQPNIINNAIFCHISNEKGHKKMLNFLNVEPILQLDMRLGEGTGCAIAYPLIQSAINFLNQMASFESANVSESFDTKEFT